MRGLVFCRIRYEIQGNDCFASLSTITILLKDANLSCENFTIPHVKIRIIRSRPVDFGRSHTLIIINQIAMINRVKTDGKTQRSNITRRIDTLYNNIKKQNGEYYDIIN